MLHSVVPTTRPRHVITETDAVARALDDAAQRWPEDADNRAALVRRLLEEGHRSIAEEQMARLLARREAVARSSGSMSGVYEPGYLEKLRQDWPE